LECDGLASLWSATAWRRFVTGRRKRSRSL